MTKGTKAVVIAAVAVVLGLGMGWLVLQLASSGQADVRLGDDEFNAGYTDVLLDALDEGDGLPLIFSDVSGGDRDIYVVHVGADADAGWFAFETRVPGREGCFAEWDADDGRFVASCDDGLTFPADGTGLTSYPTRVNEDRRLIVDLRAPVDGDGATTTTSP
ncbi:MAG: hypothetical protein KDB35_10855 [Acidimicrobiales bacterium]|nr:hypothetical protein [Acidimicrobiales bacterium]MCB1014421.1 hypothetical protein [Acidimicrobiales bacterium]MCB9373850.1 hypothetical protein [Microthrixaceae bacterium]